jgi:uncharacterized protein with PQ loop repeat
MIMMTTGMIALAIAGVSVTTMPTITAMIRPMIKPQKPTRLSTLCLFIADTSCLYFLLYCISIATTYNYVKPLILDEVKSVGFPLIFSG